MSFVVPPPAVTSIPVAGSEDRFPVRRVICVGRNYEAHAREMVDFFKERSPKLPGGPRLLAQAQEAIGLCRVYNATQQPSVKAFLEKQ